jgi:hypothetical protein
MKYTCPIDTATLTPAQHINLNPAIHLSLPTKVGRRPLLAKFTSAIHLALVRCYIGNRRFLSGISLQLHIIIQQHRFINTIAPLIQQPSHSPQKFRYFCHCQGFFSLQSPLAESSRGTLFTNYIPSATGLRFYALSHYTGQIPSLVSVLHSLMALSGSQSQGTPRTSSSPPLRGGIAEVCWLSCGTSYLL